MEVDNSQAQPKHGEAASAAKANEKEATTELPPLNQTPAANGGGVEDVHAASQKPANSLNSSGIENEGAQAEELVVKEECNFPQDEYMDDDELQLIDQQNEDSQDATEAQTDKVRVPSQQDKEKAANNSKAEETKPEEEPSKEIETPDEMKRLILTQGQLKRLQMLDYEEFRQAVTGFYVRVYYHGLPSKFTNIIFIDQIVDVLNAESFQHLYLKYRLRLRKLGDYTLDRILPTQKLKEDQDIVSLFNFMEAKDESRPTVGFIRQKEAALAEAFKILEAAEAAKKEEKTATPAIKKENLAQITLNPTNLRLLAKLDFERFKQTVTGCYVFMGCISKDKPSDYQFHLVQVQDVIHGPREYKIYNKKEIQAKVDYKLITTLYGKYIINWIRVFPKLTEEGFKLWLDDMRQWKLPIPTFDYIRDKAAQLQIAIADAERIPNLEQQERERQKEEERAKRAKLPAQNAKDLEPCTLTRPQLLKLASLSNFEQFEKTLTGCFLRLNAGATNHFEIDQVIKVEPNEPENEDAKKKARPTDKAVLKLKVTGTISLTALTYIASNFKFTEDEFRKSWLAETTEDDPLPTVEVIQQKQKKIEEAFKAVSATEGLQSPQKTPAVANVEMNNNKASGTVKGGEQPSAAEVAKGSEGAKSEEKGEEKKKSGAGEGTSGTDAGEGRLSVQVKDGELTIMELKKLIVSMAKMLEMMTLDKEALVRVLRGFYARVAAKRENKPQSLQFYVDQITGVSWGGETYRFRKVVTDIKLHFRKMGERTLYQLHKGEGGTHLNAESFQMFIDDMKLWKQPLPTLAFIEKKTREFTQAQRRSKTLSGAFGNPQSRRVFNERGSSQSTTPLLNPGLEQLQSLIQRQVASSVRTPGVAPGWSPTVAGAGGPPFVQKMTPQQQQPLMGTTSAPWQPQQPNISPYMQQQQEKESWRMQQRQQQNQRRQQMEVEAQQQQYAFQQQQNRMGELASSDGRRMRMEEPLRYSDGSGMGASALRDFGRQTRYEDRDLVGGYEMRRSGGPSAYDQPMGAYGGGGGSGYRPQMAGGLMQQSQSPLPSLTSSLSAHYNTPMYGSGGPSPAKRQRLGAGSPQPPPVERFF